MVRLVDIFAGQLGDTLATGFEAFGETVGAFVLIVVIGIELLIVKLAFRLRKEFGDLSG